MAIQLLNRQAEIFKDESILVLCVEITFSVWCVVSIIFPQSIVFAVFFCFNIFIIDAVQINLKVSNNDISRSPHDLELVYLYYRMLDNELLMRIPSGEFIE